VIRKIVIGFLVLVLFLGFGTSVNMAQQAPEKTIKIAIYDLQEVLGEYQRTKDFQAEFEKQCQQSLAKIGEKEEEIEKLKRELIAQEMMLTESAKEEKKRELEDKEKELQDLIKSIKKEIEEKRQLYTEEIIKDVLSICQILKEEKGYDDILERSSVPDLSEEILLRLNAKYEEEK